MQPVLWSSSSTTAQDITLHQIAPYIGRMKTEMAQVLIERFSRPGGVVADPFVGSGVIALEAAVRGRHVVAGDWNPYAVLLTRAKLFPPPTESAAQRRFVRVWRRSRELLTDQDINGAPQWVQNFFHAETLRSALAVREACVEAGDDFLLACLLGILHHQRPGFLSYPSSHLVPYLRNRRFPRAQYPELYEERDVAMRMRAKISRTYRRWVAPSGVRRRIVHSDARQFPRIRKVQAVITSPPYMNELDYIRDNRLRLWFINRSVPPDLELRGRDREAQYSQLMRAVCTRFAPAVEPGGWFVLVVGDATRGKGRLGRTAELTRQVFSQERKLEGFRLLEEFEDQIPDIRRARRECRGTKVETVLAYQRAP